MSKTRRGRGGVNQGNHNNADRRHTNRGRGYRGTSGGHYNNNNYRDQGTKPEGIYHNHCILAALSHLVGQTVHVRSKNDSVYEGIFTTLSPKASFVLKCVHKIDKKQVNGFTGDLSQPLPHKDSVRREIVFEFDDIISVAGKIDKPQPPVQKAPEGFTDSEVNKRRVKGGERKELQRWTDNSISENMSDLSLDTDSGNGGWTYEDMIRVNEEKFNVASMYDENMDEYTTPIPEFDEKIRKQAAQLAEEIEGRATSNVHIAEERGQIVPIDVSEEDRYSAVIRPGGIDYIEIQTNNKGRYSAADIPAPLSQVDEPTEELFKEEKEALKKQKETEATAGPAESSRKVSESEGKKPESEPLKKCVAIETQTEPNSPKHHKKTASALSPMPKLADSPKGSLPGSPQIPAESSAPATTSLNTEATPKSPSVQHTATQVITKREKADEGWKKEENVQKKIMKSDRSHQGHRKGDHKEEMSGLMNFKTKYEDSTQSKTKSPVTIAQSTAAPSQLIQPSSQQPVAVPQMIAKQRNDSMSSVQSDSNHGGHGGPYQRPSVQGIQILQHQQQQQQQMMHIQMQQQMQHQMQQQMQHMAQHQQSGHQQAVAHQMQAAQAMQMQQMFAVQQQQQQRQQQQQQHHMVQAQQHQQQIQHHQNQQQLQITDSKSNLNPDAMEFKPGSGPPTPSQQQQQQNQQQYPGQHDKNSNMVVMPQAVAVIPTPGGKPVRQQDMPIMQQAQGGALIAGQYAHPSLVLYPSNPLLARGGYIPAVSMPMQPGHANAQHQMMQEQQGQQQSGIMSPTSPTPGGPQLIYHPNPQIVSQAQYAAQGQLHPQMVHAAAASQFLQLQSQNGPYANPLQPHSGHGGAVMNTLFPYAHPPNAK